MSQGKHDRLSRAGGDTGQADPRLAAALAGTDRSEVLAALVDARVFATIAATATGQEIGAHGRRQESSAEMAVVLLEGADGARALPVFSDLGALQRWRPDGRPVSLTGAQACAAALDERATALLLDPGGAGFVVEDLRALADGFVPVGGSSLSSRRAPQALRAPALPPSPELVKALRAALKPERLRSARLLDGPGGLLLGVATDLGPAELAALAQRLCTRLGPDLPAAGLDLAQVAERGPGIEVLGRFRRGR